MPPSASTSAAPLEGANILVAVTGGIAAYKSATLVSRLAQAGASVRVLMTDAATRFISPLTFQALSAHPVYTSQWEHAEAHDPQHINLARNAHLAVVAPCTMDCMARLAQGHASDVVTVVLAAINRSTTPVLLAPAMNDVMWAQPATQRNLNTLREDGYTILGPADGWMACRSVGPGRMVEPEDILSAVLNALRPRA